MSEWNNDAKSWKRTCMVLAALLVLSVVTIMALVAIVAMRSSSHQLELQAVRAQSERDRDIVTRMWQVTNDELMRERRKAGPHARPDQ
jgi:uncharacterized protein YpmS